MKTLYIGDPHIKVSNLDEAEKLMHFAQDLALKEKVDRIILLGDLFHTHAVLRLEVLEFWDAWLDIFSELCETFVLVGNHDQTGDYNLHTNALSVFKHLQRKNRNLKIVENPQRHGLFAFMPYYHDRDEFIRVANTMALEGAKVLVCHQTFSGSTFENGFYAPEGIDPDKLNHDLVISGHIHKRQRFGKVIYPGTAKWDTASDANEPKGLWLVHHWDETGVITDESFVDTSQVVTPIISLEWKEGDMKPAALIVPGHAKISVELIGSSNWVNQQKTDLKSQFSIKTRITDKTKPENRKAGVNLEDFISNLFVSTMDKSALLNFAKELGLV